MTKYSQADYRWALYITAQQIISGEVSIPHGACALYYLAVQLGIDQHEGFDYLWAISSDCAELPMNEDDRFGRHPDWLAQQDKRVIETGEFYKERVLATCRLILKKFST